MKKSLEEILINFYKSEMIVYINNNPEIFEEAVQLAISDKQPFSWRAAWLLWSCMEENDLRIKKSINKIINALKTKKDGHQRELLKILLLMELQEKHEGVLFDICINIWKSIDKNPSVRFIALKFIVKIAKKHPELLNELMILLENHYMDSLSPAIKKSVNKLVIEFKVPDKSFNMY